MNKKIRFYEISVFIFVVGLFLLVGIYNYYQDINKVAVAIVNSYNDLSDNVINYNDIRSELEKLLSEFSYDSFSKDIDKYNDLFVRYNNVIKDIDNNINNIDDRCNYLYKDSSVNEICNNYKNLYEKLINIYIEDLSNYNKIVISYNEYSNDNIDLVDMLYEDYIDYNLDNVYEGSVKNEN